MDLFIPHTIAFRGYSKRKSDGVEDMRYGCDWNGKRAVWQTIPFIMWLLLLGLLSVSHSLVVHEDREYELRHLKSRFGVDYGNLSRGG